VDDMKKTYREGEETAKENWRKADGKEDLADKVGNAGDDIRRPTATPPRRPIVAPDPGLSGTPAGPSVRRAFWCPAHLRECAPVTSLQAIRARRPGTTGG